MNPFNYFNVSLSVMTAARARSQGIRVTVPYGYAVVSDTPLPGHLNGCERLYSWCKTKERALSRVNDWEYSKRRGFHACPCGSDKQARACCGIPAPYNTTEPAS